MSRSFIALMLVALLSLPVLARNRANSAPSVSNRAPVQYLKSAGRATTRSSAKAELAAKNAKLDAQRARIDQQNIAAQQKRNNALDAASTQVVLGIVSGTPPAGQSHKPSKASQVLQRTRRCKAWMFSSAILG